MAAGWILDAFWVGLVVVSALCVLRWAMGFLMRVVIARLFGSIIGRQAMASQPDTIHLEWDPGTWRNPHAASALSAPLVERGFRDAGVFRIAEMKDVLVQLYAQPEEGWLAAVYEHPAVGHWMDLVTKYDDGTSVTFTTARETGLDPRPGHPVEHFPRLDARGLLARAKRERPAGRPCVIAVSEVPGTFVNAYEESTRWRKEVGISAREVGRVAEQMDQAA